MTPAPASAILCADQTLEQSKQQRAWPPEWEMSLFPSVVLIRRWDPLLFHLLTGGCFPGISIPLPSLQLPLKRHLCCSCRAFVLLWMMDIVMPREFWEKQGISEQTTCNSRKMEAKSKLLFYQLLFYSFINTVVFTSIIAVNIIPKLSNT